MVPPIALSSLLSLVPLAGRQFVHFEKTPQPLVLLAAGLVLYLWGVTRNNRLHPHHRWPATKTAALLGAIVITGIATSSFLDFYDTTLFWDHMIQHLVLIMVSGLLFAFASPVDLAWRASTGGAHRLLGAVLRSSPVEVLGHPITAFVLYAVVIPITHLTVFFTWTLEHEQIHELEHLVFVVVGFMFWRQLFGSDPNRFRMQPPMKALVLFIALPVDTFVGLTLDSENHEIFPALARVHQSWAPPLVTDLHIGGVIMWVGGDVLMMLALIPVVVAWVRKDERQARVVDRELAAYFPATPPAVGMVVGQPTAGFALGTHTPRTSSHPGPGPSRRPDPGRPSAPPRPTDPPRPTGGA